MVAITQDIINKIQSFTTNIIEKMNSIIAIHNIDSSAHDDKQLKDNLVTSWGNVTSDTKYPSEKLVYSTLQNFNLSEEPGTFSELQDLIDEAESGSVITLDKDYKYQENDNEPIYITKNLIIVGNGHTLTGNEQESVIIVMPYDFSTQSDVHYFCLYDTVITKGGGRRSSIRYNALNGLYFRESKIIGCTFIDNLSGAIDIYSGTIKDCNFISNNSRYSIVNINSLTSMENCTFIGNKAENIHSVYEINVYNCVFIDGSNYNVKNITYPDLTEEWYEFYDDMAN